MPISLPALNSSLAQSLLFFCFCYVGVEERKPAKVKYSSANSCCLVLARDFLGETFWGWGSGPAPLWAPSVCSSWILCLGRTEPHEDPVPWGGKSLWTDSFVYLQFLLKCSWVTMLWYFLLYSNSRQLSRNMNPFSWAVLAPSTRPRPRGPGQRHADRCGMPRSPLAVHFTRRSCDWPH